LLRGRLTKSLVFSTLHLVLEVPDEHKRFMSDLGCVGSGPGQTTGFIRRSYRHRSPSHLSGLDLSIPSCHTGYPLPPHPQANFKLPACVASSAISLRSDGWFRQTWAAGSLRAPAAAPPPLPRFSHSSRRHAAVCNTRTRRGRISCSPGWFPRTTRQQLV